MYGFSYTVLFFYMGFADKYLQKQNRHFLYEYRGYTDTSEMVVVIPAYNEPGLSCTIQSLFECRNPGCQLQVVVVVNHSDSDCENVVLQNDETIAEIQKLRTQAPTWMNVHAIYTKNLPSKHAGAGWARKIGMDWAISLFNKNDNPDGLIVSLDADTLVENNYLQALLQHFKAHPAQIASTLYFEHPYYEVSHKEGVILYELYMRYYKHAIAYTGFPHSVYTLGSCFAVKALAYVAQGGMNRKKAGEDFYFLHKLMPLGKVGYITGTTVYPSPRLSNRVPFGTGPALQQFEAGNRDLYYTYPLHLFETLRTFFIQSHLFYYTTLSDVADLTDNVLLAGFLETSGFVGQLNKLKQNCGSEQTFQLRFFHLFDAFKILKFLNYALMHGTQKQLLETEAQKLLKQTIQSENTPCNAKNLLSMYRAIDKNSKI